MTEDVKLFLATKSLIVKDGKVLLLREAGKYQDGTNEGSYDVPGGRLKPGEPALAALEREVLEETGLRIEVGKPFAVGEWRPVVRGEQWQVVAVFFLCTPLGGQVTLSEDHDDYRWADLSRIESLPVIENLRHILVQLKDEVK